MKTKILIIPSEKDIDDMGHVNNCMYVKYLEKARLDWYENTGATRKLLGDKNLGTVVLKLEVLFQKEAKLGDSLKVITQPLKLGNTSFVLKQDIYNQFEELITEAKITSVMFDRTTRKSTKVIDRIAEKFNDVSYFRIP
jgi:YbgC/YbaW family acyl-CoA thioester hydrolase